MKLSKLSLLDLQKTQNYAQSIISIHICRAPYVFFQAGNSNKLFVSYTSNRIDKSPLHLWRVGFEHFLLKQESILQCSRHIRMQMHSCQSKNS